MCSLMPEGWTWHWLMCCTKLIRKKELCPQGFGRRKMMISSSALVQAESSMQRSKGRTGNKPKLCHTTGEMLQKQKETATPVTSETSCQKAMRKILSWTTLGDELVLCFVEKQFSKQSHGFKSGFPLIYVYAMWVKVHCQHGETSL